LFVFWLF